MQKQYRICVNAKADDSNVIRYGKFRFTILTDKLIRIEYGQSDFYTDLPTQMVWFRDFPKVEFQIIENTQSILIETNRVILSCQNSGQSLEDVLIVCKGKTEKDFCWRFGDEVETLKGTVRTLDLVDGQTPLEEGILSRKGCSVLDDSKSYLIREDGELQQRSGEETDIYFFGYGHDYKECLKDYFKLTGSSPLLPRYALGNWWSRFHRYTDDEYLCLMDAFAEKKVPLSVAIIDMDWHLTQIDPKYGNGWTGYTWNKAFFKNPNEFLEKLHNRGLKVSLNVHPADGVRAFEEPYKEMVEAVGPALNVDKEKEEPIRFDVTNAIFMEAYFKYLHEPNEKIGVDFWWVDWQQGENSDLPGLDPLWVLNHYHYLDNAKNNKRPLILSRYAGAGSHRYPVGFSGDTYISWESLQFQPYFTATASNIGYGWWSHDIGGHMQGVYDEELQIRWIQWGVFSPINRMHSSASEFNHKEPWNYSEETNRVICQYLRLRHQLIPYLYTMNWLSHKEGEMLLQPMYYHYPENEEAYHVPNEYFFGTEMLCLPITSLRIKHLQLAKVKGWLPEGIYFDWQRGTIYKGSRFVWFYRRIDEMPVLLKAGAIVVCDDEIDGNAMNNPDTFSITVTAGEDGRFSLYEDDGESLSYRNGESIRSDFVLDFKNVGEFHLLKEKGNVELIPQKRYFKIRFLGFAMTGPIFEIRNGIQKALSFEYNEDKNEIMLSVEKMVGEEIIIRFANGMKIGCNNVAQLCFDVLDKAGISYNLKEEIYEKIRKAKDEDRLKILKNMELDQELYRALEEKITAQGE